MPKKRDRTKTQDSAKKEEESRRESGRPGGGQGRRDEVGPTGVYPMSAGIPPGRHPEIRTMASWGQGKRGAEGYNDSGGSGLVWRDGQLLGGLTAGPGGEPTIDIHGGAPLHGGAPRLPAPKRSRKRSKGTKARARKK